MTEGKKGKREEEKKGVRRKEKREKKGRGDNTDHQERQTRRWHPGQLFGTGRCSKQLARSLSAQGRKTQTVLYIVMATVPWKMRSPQRAAVGKRGQEKSLALASTAALCLVCSASLIPKKSRSTDAPPSPSLILSTDRGLVTWPLPLPCPLARKM